MPAGAPRDRPLPAAAPLWPSPWGGALSLPALAMHGWRPSALPGPRTPLHTRPLAVQPLPLGRTSRRPPVPPCLPGRELCSTVRSSTAAPVPCRACQEVPRNLPLLPPRHLPAGLDCGLPLHGRAAEAHPPPHQACGTGPPAAGTPTQCRTTGLCPRLGPEPPPAAGSPSGPSERHRHELRAPPIPRSLRSPWPEGSAAARGQCDQRSTVPPPCPRPWLPGAGGDARPRHPPLKRWGQAARARGSPHRPPASPMYCMSIRLVCPPPTDPQSDQPRRPSWPTIGATRLAPLAPRHALMPGKGPSGRAPTTTSCGCGGSGAPGGPFPSS